VRRRVGDGTGPERCAWKADIRGQGGGDLPMTLFDTPSASTTGDREREVAGMYCVFLHDIGNHISYEKHVFATPTTWLKQATCAASIG
jgi:hypothetical protein